ncbi:hypothetical protein E4J89_15290 [Arthrobacter sp. CAU 1506]|nr:acyltransferase family protein [Arthrobacter sp. CAU 1506]TJY67441.1 hypothetical protein E4J89_15290 [Arthrobacter sp. CAU 1506]
MLALVYWQLLLPQAIRFQRTALVVSVVAAVAAGCFGFLGNEFAVSRAVVFLPFYVLGAVFGHRIVGVAARLPIVAKAGLAAASGALTWVVFRADLSPWWFFASRSYEDLNADAGEGALMRAGLLSLSALMVFAFLAFMPDRQGRIAAAGRRSLAVYLFHGFIIMGLAMMMPAVLEDYGRWVALGVCLLVAVAVVAVFSHPGFDAVLRTYRDRVVGLAPRRQGADNAS